MKTTKIILSLVCFVFVTILLLSSLSSTIVFSQTSAVATAITTTNSTDVNATNNSNTDNNNNTTTLFSSSSSSIPAKMSDTMNIVNALSQDLIRLNYLLNATNTMLTNTVKLVLVLIIIPTVSPPSSDVAYGLVQPATPVPNATSASATSASSLQHQHQKVKQQQPSSSPQQQQQHTIAYKKGYIMGCNDSPDQDNYVGTGGLKHHTKEFTRGYNVAFTSCNEKTLAAYMLQVGNR